MCPRSLILAFVALVWFGSSPSSQSPSGKVYARYGKPLKPATLDLSTGTLTRGPAVHDRAGNTVVDFYNNDLGGFVGVDSGNGFCEWIDAAVKGFAGNASDLMNDIVFAYCSAKLCVASGGPGGGVRLGFYEGYTTFGGAPTTTVAALTLTGLPAHSASSSFFGGFSCHFMHVVFGPLVAFADGPIGYSWRFVDLGTDGVLGGTWPYLSCVMSCSGTIGSIDGQGMTNLFDQYCPPGNLRTIFTFASTSGSFTSVSMEIREAQDTPSSHALYNAAPDANPDVISTSFPTAPPGHRIGESFTWNLARGTPTVPGSWTMTVRPNRVPLPNGLQGPPPLPVGAGGRILISGPQLGGFAGTHNGFTGSIGGVIPASLGLVNVHFAAQATILGGGVRVSSGIEGTIGA